MLALLAVATAQELVSVEFAKREHISMQLEDVLLVLQQTVPLATI